MEKGQYKTKQREEIINYLCSVSGEHVTVNDVCRYFETSGKKIGTTTVYRQLEKLVDEGSVKKYVLEPGTPACFEYIDPENNCQKTNCFHLKCTKCGKLIHLHCDELEATENHILEHHNFMIDSRRTVFYGFCEECR